MRVHWSKQRSCQSVLVQQSRWFQHLPKEVYEYSDTRLPQGCSAMRENIEFGCAKDKDSSENTLTSERGGKKGQELSWDRKQQGETGWLFQPAWKSVTTTLLRECISLLSGDLTGQTDFDKLPALISKLFPCWNMHQPRQQADSTSDAK